MSRVTSEPYTRPVLPRTSSATQALALKTCVNGRKVYGGPARESVEKQIALIEEFVEARACSSPMLTRG